MSDASTPKAIYRHIPISALSGDELLALSQKMKLSLSKEDMLAVQAIFREESREPTDVELEVIAQTWSEHCKHRIFGALIEHTLDGKTEVIDSLYKTYIRNVTGRIRELKPDFVLSAFVDFGTAAGTGRVAVVAGALPAVFAAVETLAAAFAGAALAGARVTGALVGALPTALPAVLVAGVAAFRDRDTFLAAGFFVVAMDTSF